MFEGIVNYFKDAIESYIIKDCNKNGFIPPDLKGMSLWDLIDFASRYFDKNPKNEYDPDLVERDDTLSHLTNAVQQLKEDNGKLHEIIGNKVVGCECGNTNYKSDYESAMDQYYTYAECDKCGYYWEGYTNFSFEKKREISKSERFDMDVEYDRYFQKVMSCKDNDEVLVEWSRHEANKYFIQQKYIQSDNSKSKQSER